ncbi:MAG: hypothetical protein JNK27_13030 [Chitinophagaceae bacterium]|nr:hypothetical protein [Chitinophagaceae bacterium]
MKLLVLLLYLFSNPVHLQSCRSLKKGVFANEEMDTVIVRTKTHQTEVSEKNGINFTWRLNWLNDCEYNMILEKDISTTPLVVFKIGDTIRVKISKIYKDKYDWEASFKGHTLHGFNYILDTK